MQIRLAKFSTSDFLRTFLPFAADTLPGAGERLHTRWTRSSELYVRRSGSRNKESQFFQTSYTVLNSQHNPMIEIMSSSNKVAVQSSIPMPPTSTGRSALQPIISSSSSNRIRTRFYCKIGIVSPQPITKWPTLSVDERTVRGLRSSSRYNEPLRYAYDHRNYKEKGVEQREEGVEEQRVIQSAIGTNSLLIIPNSPTDVSQFINGEEELPFPLDDTWASQQCNSQNQSSEKEEEKSRVNFQESVMVVP